MSRPKPRHSSPEFGSFSSATPVSALSNEDLISFDDLDHHQPSSSSSRTPNSPPDNSWLDDLDPLRPSPPKPIHVTLPPRPDEITPDYTPPVRIPRRLSQHAQQYSFAGPSSPPLISDAQIIFHPSNQSQENATASMRRARQNSFRLKSSSDMNNGDTSSKFHTFTNTARLASKWRASIAPGDFAGPEKANDLPGNNTALPIDITHTTPFASAEQVAGSYIAPSGAPGFIPQQHTVTSDIDHSYLPINTIRLVGRRETTVPILTSPIAETLRPHLPPRQRISRTWTLLFSLDQHGASLATLYGLSSKYASTHPNTGNIMILRDGNDNLFGVFLNDAIARREGEFYGGGESFLFKIGIDGTEIFPWTGRYQYFALCEAEHLSFGGGGSAYGLVVDNKFSRNSSSTSPVFDNDVLCIPQSVRSERAHKFDCVGVEVWGPA